MAARQTGLREAVYRDQKVRLHRLNVDVNVVIEKAFSDLKKRHSEAVEEICRLRKEAIADMRQIVNVITDEPLRYRQRPRNAGEVNDQYVDRLNAETSYTTFCDIMDKTTRNKALALKYCLVLSPQSIADLQNEY